MMIGTDRKAFGDLWGMGPQPTHFYPMWPMHPESIFTPLEKLPAETRLLYDYNPELARQMLETALGPPDADGFFFKIDHIVLKGLAHALDNAAMLAYQWDKIGVEVAIKVYDATAHSRAKFQGEYSGSLTCGFDTANPLNTFIRHGQTGQVLNYGVWSDEYFDELCGKMKVELDVDKRNRLYKEAAVYMLNEAINIPLRVNLEGHYWWPWIKNFYGEIYLGDHDHITPLAHAWLDLALKAEMGY